MALLQSLYQYFAEQRSQEKFGHYFARGKMLCGATRFSEKRLPRSKRTPDDTSDTGIVFNAEDRFRIQTYFPILYALMNDLNRRIEAYPSTENRFAFMRDSDANAASAGPSELMAILKENDFVSSFQMFMSFC